ncbi:hypothetical protein Drorol1_Dr00012270 [Drosera rotundifolia]
MVQSTLDLFAQSLAVKRSILLHYIGVIVKWSNALGLTSILCALVNELLYWFLLTTAETSENLFMASEMPAILRDVFLPAKSLLFLMKLSLISTEIIFICTKTLEANSDRLIRNKYMPDMSLIEFGFSTEMVFHVSDCLMRVCRPCCWFRSVKVDCALPARLLKSRICPG